MAFFGYYLVPRSNLGRHGILVLAHAFTLSKIGIKNNQKINKKSKKFKRGQRFQNRKSKSGQEGKREQKVFPKTTTW